MDIEDVLAIEIGAKVFGPPMIKKLSDEPLVMTATRTEDGTEDAPFVRKVSFDCTYFGVLVGRRYAAVLRKSNDKLVLAWKS